MGMVLCIWSCDLNNDKCLSHSVVDWRQFHLPYHIITQDDTHWFWYIYQGPICPMLLIHKLCHSRLRGPVPPQHHTLPYIWHFHCSCPWNSSSISFLVWMLQTFKIIFSSCQMYLKLMNNKSYKNLPHASGF